MRFPVTNISQSISAVPKSWSQPACAVLGYVLSPRALFFAAILGASAELLLRPGLTAPFDRTGDLDRCVIETGLLTIVTLVSRWFPASGPRFGEKVSLLPYAALAALLLVPPGFAVIPVLLAGSATVLLDRDADSRSSQIDRILLLIASQLWVCAAFNLAQSNHSLDIFLMNRSDQIRVDAVAALIFGALYIGGVGLSVVRNPDGVVRTVPKQRGWRVYWFNEAVVYCVGCPHVLAVCVVMQHVSALAGLALLVVVATAVLTVTHSLVDGKMVRRQLHAMDRLTQQAAIGKSPSSERFLTDFLEHCSRIVLYDKACVWLHNEEELVLDKCLEYIGKPVSFQPAVRRSGEELVGRVAERSRAILVDDVRRDARHRYCALTEDNKRAMGRVSAMLIPLLAAGELVGVVEFERYGAAGYARQDRERVQSLAGLVAMSLANNRQHQDVVQQAVTDALTGLYNKRQILKTLADEAARALRYGHTLSVMMLDLDGFKMFNDTYGHMQGDVLLQCMSGLIKQSIRTSDVGGRYGGEEFIVVMPETGREAAWVTAERIRARVEAEAFVATVNYEAAIGLQEPTEDRAPRRVTVHKTISIGVATLPADAIDAQELLARADEALYTAKNSGRNRVVLAGYLAESLPRTVTAETAAATGM
jgi:diguanylate cyclase (GGDEF)-like protein